MVLPHNHAFLFFFTDIFRLWKTIAFDAKMIVHIPEKTTRVESKGVKSLENAKLQTKAERRTAQAELILVIGPISGLDVNYYYYFKPFI